MKKKSGRNKNWEKPDYNQYRFSPKEMVFNAAQILLLTGGIDYLCYRSWWALLGGIPLGYWYIRQKKKEKIQKRKRLLAYHFQDALYGLQTAVRAGYSMEYAVVECRKELEQIYGKTEDLVREFLYMERQMRVGIPLEQLFLDLGRRADVEDIRDFGEIFLISRKSGGNLGDILEKMAHVIGEKIQVSREIDVTIAGKKLEQTVMSLVPGGMILYMQATSEGFLDILYHNPLGCAVMTGCLAVYGFGYWMGKKIVRIAV